MTEPEKSPKTGKAMERASILASAPLFASILHLLGNVFFLTSVKVDEAAGRIEGVASFPVLFGAGELGLLLSSPEKGLSAVKAFVSGPDLLMGLLLVFLSYYAVKGKKNCLYLAFGAYLLDTALMAASLVLGPRSSVLSLRVVDYVLPPLLHALVLLLTALALVFDAKARKEEKPEGLYVSKNPKSR